MKLHDHLLKAVNDDRTINNPNEDTGSPLLLVPETIIKACMSFEARAMVKCNDPYIAPDVPAYERYEMKPVTYTKAFSASIAQRVSIPTKPT